jgi:hypothetical protein
MAGVWPGRGRSVNEDIVAWEKYTDAGTAG